MKLMTVMTEIDKSFELVKTKKKKRNFIFYLLCYIFCFCFLRFFSLKKKRSFTFINLQQKRYSSSLILSMVYCKHQSRLFDFDKSFEVDQSWRKELCEKEKKNKRIYLQIRKMLLRNTFNWFFASVISLFFCETDEFFVFLFFSFFLSSTSDLFSHLHRNCWNFNIDKLLKF